MTYDKKFVAVFWSAVRKSGRGCWVWQRPPAKSGYGQITCRRLSKAPMLAHRISWELANGDVPNGLHVLHSCDNRACVRPSHLFTGTQRDNNLDRTRKGRTASGDRNGARTRRERNSFVRNGGSGLKGEDHPMAKLSNVDVASLLHEYAAANGVRGTKHRLAVKYHITDTHAGRLIRKHQS